MPVRLSVSAPPPGATGFAWDLAGRGVFSRHTAGPQTVLSFTTPATAPVVATSAVTLLTSTTVTLNGSANPGGDTTTGWFRYATTSPGACGSEARTTASR